MQRIVSTLAAIVFLNIATGCGPKCLDVKTAMSVEETKYDDAVRIIDYEVSKEFIHWVPVYVE